MDFSGLDGLGMKPYLRIRFRGGNEYSVTDTERSLVVKGAVFRNILPLLDGTLCAEEIAYHCCDFSLQAHVWYAIYQLGNAGFLRTNKRRERCVSLPGWDHEIWDSKSDIEFVLLASTNFLCRSHARHPEMDQPIIVSGFGQTADSALTRCSVESFERLSGFANDRSNNRVCYRSELRGIAIDPSELIQVSALQYEDRHILNAHARLMDRIPIQYEDKEPIEWSLARQLHDNRTIWLPTAICTYSRVAIPGKQHGNLNSSGCAAHVTREKAILSGLLELLEHDACAIWWYNQLRCPGVNLSSFEDSGMTNLLSELEGHGRQVRILNLSLDFGVFVIAAVSWSNPGFSQPALGLGAKFYLHHAVTKALGELASQVFAAPETDLSSVSESCLPEHILPFGVLSSGQAKCEPGSVDALLKKLQDKGLTGAVLDQFADNQEKRYAVRVVVPGLRSLAAHFGPGRLYDVPREHFGVAPATEVEMRAMRTITETFYSD